MKLILKKNVAELGYKDDVVEVKDGYGRNYLIPQGKAIIASNAALKQLAEDQRQRAHKLAKIKEEAENAAKALEGLKLVIGAKTSSTCFRSPRPSARPATRLTASSSSSRSP